MRDLSTIEASRFSHIFSGRVQKVPELPTQSLTEKKPQAKRHGKAMNQLPGIIHGFPGVFFWLLKVRGCIKIDHLVINHQSDLFGMVKSPFQGVKRPPTRGWKGHELNHLVKISFFAVVCFFCFVDSPPKWSNRPHQTICFERAGKVPLFCWDGFGREIQGSFNATHLFTGGIKFDANIAKVMFRDFPKIIEHEIWLGAIHVIDPPKKVPRFVL